MTQHAQLAVNQIRGPFMQLLTNLQGKEGRMWLDALCVFLRKENPWTKPASQYDAFEFVHENLQYLNTITLKPDVSVYLAWKVIQASDGDEPLLQFFLGFGTAGPDDDEVLLEFEEVVSLRSITSLVTEEDWSNIRDGVRDDYTPTDIFLNLGVQTLLKGQPLSTEVPPFTDTFIWYLEIPGRSKQTLAVHTNLGVLKPFLTVNPE